MSSLFYVVVPAYNEEKALEKTVLDVLSNDCVDKVIIVDNNSTDNSFQIATDISHRFPDKVAVKQEFRQGKGNAFESALSLCASAEYVGIIDADDTYPASAFDYLYKETVNNNLDMIVGNRFGNNNYAENDARSGHVWGNRALSKLIKFVSSVDIEDALSGQRVFSKRFIETYKALADGFQLETEFSVHCGVNGFSYGERTISYQERSDDNPSKLSTYRDGFRILNFALKNSAFTFTSKIGIFFGILMISLGGFWGFSLILEFLYKGKVTSVAAAVAVSVLLSAGLQMIIASTIENRLRRIERQLLRK